MMPGEWQMQHATASGTKCDAIGHMLRCRSRHGKAFSNSSAVDPFDLMVARP